MVLLWLKEYYPSAPFQDNKEQIPRKVLVLAYYHDDPAIRLLRNKNSYALPNSA